MQPRRGRGGVGWFIFFLLLFLVAAGGATYFFFIHPAGKKALAGFLRQFLSHGEPEAPPPKPPAPPPTPAPPQAPAPAAPAAEERQRARAFLAAGDTDTAERHARKAVDLNPGDPESVELLKAVLLAKKAAAAPPAAAHKAEAARFIAVARTCHDNGDFASAAAFLRKALEIDPDNVEAAASLRRASEALKAEEQRADVLKEQLAALKNEMEKTRQELAAKQAASAAPDPGKAILEEKIRKLEEAMRDGAARAAAGAEDVKQRAGGLLAQARQFLVTGAANTARQVALKALELDPGNAEVADFLRILDEKTPPPPAPPPEPSGADKAQALVSQAQRLYDAGAYASARDVALRALGLDPENQEVPALLRKIEEATRPPAAPQPAQPAPQPRPQENALALFEQASRLFEAGAYMSAKDVALKALGLDPANRDVTELLKKIDAAVAAREQLAAPQAREPSAAEKAQALAGQAQRLLEAGSLASARDVALRALELDPENRGLPGILQRIEAAGARTRPAPPVATPATPPDNEAAARRKAFELFSSARALREQGALNSALETARKALELDPRNPEIAVFIAAVERDIKALAAAPAPPVQPQPVEPPPLPADTTPVKPPPADTAPPQPPLSIEQAAAAVSTLDAALEAGSAERFLAALTDELAAAERDNLVQFFRLVGNLKVRREEKPRLVQPATAGTICIRWPYTLAYDIAGSRVEKVFSAEYVLGRDAAGALKILEVSSKPSAK